MIKFVKYQDKDNKFDHTKLILKTDAETLPEILQDFEDFLKGIGFHFKGNIEVVDNEDDLDE